MWFRRAYLGLGAGWVGQVLAGHLDGLVSSGKLGRVHQTFLTGVAVGVRNANQVSRLRGEKKQLG